MKKLFKFNNLEQTEKFIEIINAQNYNIVIDAENNQLLINDELHNYNIAIMYLMDVISKNEHIQHIFTAWYDGLDKKHDMPKFLNEKPHSMGWSIEGKTIENGIIKDFSITEIKEEWEKEAKQNIHNLGIKDINEAYIETNELQEAKYEYKKITKFLSFYKEEYAEKKNQNPNNIKIEFINYGKTELVFVLTDENNNRYTLLVKQPKVDKIEIIDEINNLYELKEIDDNVIAAIDIFSLYDQILFVTPYINQARCIASDNKWGMYIPEPFYRFENFTKQQESIVNQCMIAKLISYYNFEEQEGLASCKLGGGDFMLPKGWENETPTIENTFNNLYFIAARKKVKCSFEDYIEILEDEFSRRTIDEDEENLIINKRGRVAMNKTDIISGIELGKRIIKDRKGFCLNKK